MSPLSDDAPGAARQAARRAARAAGTLAVVAYALIVVGALVRAHGAGLSCPDWPLCFGQVLPRLDFRVAFEFGHRVLAGSLGLALCGLAYYVLSSRVLPARFGLRLAGVFALLGVQVVLGGLTVLLGLAPWTVTAHLLTGNAFALSLAWLARDFAEASRAEAVARSPLPASVSRGMAIAATLVVLQLQLGGLV